MVTAQPMDKVPLADHSAGADPAPRHERHRGDYRDQVTRTDELETRA